MGRTFISLLIVLMLALTPCLVASVVEDNGTRGPDPLAGGSPWTDSFEDMSGVYTPPGGLVGVEVTGGEVRLLPGYETGWIASRAIECPSDFRYDLVLLDASIPGNSSVQVSILDPSSSVSDDHHANGTVSGLVNVTRTDISLTSLDQEFHPKIRVQVRLVANGTDRPTLQAWTVLFGDPGEWRDEFLGTGKMIETKGINITADAVEVDLSQRSSGVYGIYERYPSIMICDSRIADKLTIIHPNAEGTGYGPKSFVPANGTFAVEFGDLDKDGNLDLVCANNIDAQGAQPDHEILWGKAGDRWSYSGVKKLKSVTARDVKLGDFNGDSWLDIVFGCYDSPAGTLYVFLNDGQGGFAYNPDISLDSRNKAVWSLGTGDLNSDEYDDIVVLRNNPGDTYVHEGGPDGPPTVPTYEFSRGTGGSSVLCQDLDGDGHLDLLFGQFWGEVTLFLGGQGRFGGSADYRLDTGLNDMIRSVSAGDLNGDGNIDLVTSGVSGSKTGLCVFEGGLHGWNNASTHTTMLDDIGRTTVIDVDKDGYDDIIVGLEKKFMVIEGAPNYDLNEDITVAKTGTTDDVWDIEPIVEPGGDYLSGSFTTERIRKPSDKTWDILDLRGTFPDNTSSIITVTYENGTPVSGYESILYRNLDLSGLANLDAIRVMVSLISMSNSSTPIVDHLLVNWMDKWEWRDQFYGPAKIVRIEGLGIKDDELKRYYDTGNTATGSYLSKAFGPEDSREADNFHTLRYTARLGSSQAGTIRLLDATTSQTLGQASLASGIQEWDLTSEFRLREHPSIQVNITVTGLDLAGEFGLDDLRINWTPRSNQPPDIIDLWPEAPSVERTETVELYLNVSDDYDDVGNLTIKLVHSLQGSGILSTTLFDPTKERTYENGLLVYYVNPPYDAALGNYSFGVNVTDMDGSYTGFIEYPAMLEVLPGLPSGPTNFIVKAMDSAVELEWREPRDKGDSAILGYQILRGMSNDSLGLIAKVGSFDISYLDEDVLNRETYFYAVRAYTANGNGELTDVLEARPIGKPMAPIGLEAQLKEGQVLLSWNPPVNDGGYPILDYYIHQGLTEGPLTWETTVTGTEHIFTELTKGKTYYFAVSARNEMGEGPMSAVVSITYVTLPSAPLNLVATGDRLTVMLSWYSPADDGGLEISGFVVYRGEDDDSLEELSTWEASPTIYTDEEVQAGVTYNYAVAAVTSYGEGPMSGVASALPIGPPGIPGDLKAISGDGEVTLTWTAPENDGGSSITGYIIMRGSSPDDLTRLSQVSNLLTYVDDKVMNGETYHYAVAAVNDVDEGPLTTSVDTTPVRQPTVPGLVRLLVGEAKGGKVMLSWAAPEDDGGSPLTGYVVLRGSSEDDIEIVATLGDVITWTDEDVRRGNTYLYSVVALNDHGHGEPIDEVKVMVPKKKEEGPGFGVFVAIVAMTLSGILLQRRR
jgi:hypothetical protein